MGFMAALKELLLVEDSENDLELTMEALREVGLANNISVARDGAEALDYLYRRGLFAQRQPEPPIVILLDLKLPKIGGLEVIKVMKGDPELSSIPIVVLTSSREERDLVNLGQDA